MPSQILTEADNNFIGFNSRLDPSNLEPGFAQASKNVRLQRGTAQPRKGCMRLTDGTLNLQTMVGSGTYVDANGQDNIVLVFTGNMRLYNTETKTLSPTVHNFPTGRTIAAGSQVDVVQALDKLYIFRGQEVDARIGNGTTATAALDGTKAGLQLTYPTIAAGATATVTATCINSTSHNYAIGDEVTIFNVYESANPSKAVFNNTFIVKTVTGTSAFTFDLANTAAGAVTIAASPAYACSVRVKPPLIWDAITAPLIVAPQTSIYGNIQKTSTGADAAGNGSVPPSDFAFYYQNRLVCKIYDTQLAVGDILSPTFDFTLNNFIINQGGNDAIVGVLPWIENQFLVFMNKSICVAFVEPTTYTIGAAPGENSSITVVTTQIGCLSRRSIVAAGQFVFFLSGKGVHVLTPQLDLKLLGNTLPLSEPIDDFFDDVNYQAISSSVAAYYDNRFFIAVPVGDTTTRPNAILVYNTLNQAWETIDTYPNGLWIDNYAVCQYEKKRRLFMLTNFVGSANPGGIFLTEENEGGDQFSYELGTPILPFFLPATITSSGARLTAIDASIRSREYTFGNVNQKRFSRAEYQFNNSAGDFVKIYARNHDPDSAELVMAYQFSGSNTLDSTLRPRIATRGATIDMEVQFITGRPSLKTAVVYAIVANRAMVSEE